MRQAAEGGAYEIAMAWSTVETLGAAFVDALVSLSTITVSFHVGVAFYRRLVEREHVRLQYVFACMRKRDVCVS